MSERVGITISIPHRTWEIIQRSTLELQTRAREQGMAGASFDPFVHAAMLHEQAVSMAAEQQKRR